jgi:hypothetical protein
MKQLNESFDHLDLQNQLEDVVSVDEYAAKMGSDDEIITLAFTVKGEQASEDLVDWFERGYSWVLDCQVSEGEVELGKFLVFVEMNRRLAAPERIIELLDDLETLTGIKAGDWKVKIADEEYPADEAIIKDKVILSPHLYREQKEAEEAVEAPATEETPVEPEEETSDEAELNEMRTAAGLKTQNVYTKQDSLLRDFLSKAGL